MARKDWKRLADIRWYDCIHPAHLVIVPGTILVVLLLMRCPNP